MFIGFDIGLCYVYCHMTSCSSATEICRWTFVV